MKTFILIFFVLLSSLYATSATQEELTSIYIEAILFVSVFGIMGIISYIYSSKHAKAYKPKKEEVAKDRIKADRIEELRELLEKELITKVEFELLKEHYLK
ncbi:hypothetical protein M947_00245 [Sulfurimonas hongkongensis]|uniref:SHOCT domain-containing protein n=1 Tax=Sulfurimonas hongkongensis TaxID=1172190 RepID=T0KUS3_9BACT|nr:hypothetical protein [Sulfurimonas hongkongensis]EQB40714.1 hypothetical protein M947_00245 [Sulfurimonas hongkongensis]